MQSWTEFYKDFIFSIFHCNATLSKREFFNSTRLQFFNPSIFQFSFLPLLNDNDLFEKLLILNVLYRNHSNIFFYFTSTFLLLYLYFPSTLSLPYLYRISTRNLLHIPTVGMSCPLRANTVFPLWE